MTTSVLNLAALKAAPLNPEPYPYVVIKDFIDPALEQAVTDTFPAIDKTGSFPTSAFPLSGATQTLIQALDSNELRAAVAAKFAIDLHNRPATITLRGYCTLERDGKIHTDSKDKLITVLVYLGADPAPNPSDGCLRILYNNHDLERFAAEIRPEFGNCVMFEVTDHGWHGFKPVQGPRRSIQLCYVVSDRAARKNIWRHKLAALIKRFF